MKCPAQRANSPTAHAGSSGYTWFFFASSSNSDCICFTLSGYCARQIVGLRVVLAQVVQLPWLLASCSRTIPHTPTAAARCVPHAIQSS